MKMRADVNKTPPFDVAHKYSGAGFCNVSRDLLSQREYSNEQCGTEKTAEYQHDTTASCLREIQCVL
jgi:hypothetical protein